MNKYEINRMDIDKYRELLDDAVWTNETFALGMHSGHTNIHYDEDCNINHTLVRLIKEDKKAVCNFDNSEDAISIIQSAVSTDIKNITNWMMKEKKEFDDESKYYEYAVSINMKEHVGKGIIRNKDNSFEEKEIQAVRIVLQREYSDLCPYGFYLKTAYPDIYDKNSITTQKISKEDIIERNLFTFNDKYEKAAFKYNGKAGVIVTYENKEYDTPFIKAYFSDKENRYKCYINEDKLRIKTKAHNSDIYKSSNLEDLPEKLRAVVSEISNDIKDRERVPITQKTFNEIISDVQRRYYNNKINTKETTPKREDTVL